MRNDLSPENMIPWRILMNSGHSLLCMRDSDIRKRCAPGSFSGRAILDCKRREAHNRLNEKTDMVITNAFYREGGIKFFAEMFIERAETVAVPSGSISDMYVALYSSILEPLLTAAKKLSSQIQDIRREGTYMRNTLSSADCLPKVLGLADTQAELRQLRDLLSDPDCSQTKAESLYRRIETDIADNKALIDEALRESRKHRTVDRTRDKLFYRIDALAEHDCVRTLSDSGSASPADYAKAVRACSGLLKKLLITAEKNE